ncbi:hypothetical protein [Paraburkholderia phytofirmans]|uniref:Uncharacterized protein n=1 Tax=Paraburkholderia phytofirmans (strain DSM 17436 / LMG 22146 / PsJN) TaxID=398527 RepID=B2T0F4_PARPJ|nr:hypothetical protein [Paraburkholderia phytofirmans]ACD15256.1 conserved hypothetical protein [Paraburkholderia phytofirmans PsJN]
MLSDLTSDQHDPFRCGHCGVPLPGRFTPCPSCHRRPADSFGVRPAPPASLKVPLSSPLDDSQPLVDSRLPARRIWNPSSRALVNPYEFVEEPEVAVSAYQRLRQPLVLGASALVVTSAVYLGFIHSNDSNVGTPIAVSGKVKTQNVAPLVVPQKPAATVAQRPAPAAPQKPAIVAVQKPAAVAVQKPAAAATQKPATVVAQKPVIAPSAATQKPAVTASAQRATTTTTIAAVRPAPLRSPPIPPADTAPPLSRRVASVGPEAKRNPGGQSGNAPEQPRADMSRHLKAARANLQQNNLSATRARLAAIIAVQPNNRDALNMRSTLNTREQQRDALLSLARGCGYIARWACVSHNAGTALRIDASSKEAQRLVTLAQRETELQIPPPVEPAPEPAPDIRDVSNHH